jgi:hypothetical protein
MGTRRGTSFHEGHSIPLISFGIVGFWKPPQMESSLPGKQLLAYAICAEDPRHFSEGFADIRDAPAVCPVCGKPLHTVCPRCGMLYRTGTGICSNCGEQLQPAGGHARPATRPE